MKKKIGLSRSTKKIFEGNLTTTLWWDSERERGIRQTIGKNSFVKKKPVIEMNKEKKVMLDKI